MSEQTQELPAEPFCDRVSVAVTEREKRAVRFLAAVEDTTESDILRRYLLRDVVQIADERRARLSDAA